MLLCLRAESQLIDVVDDLAQVVTTLYLVLDLPENLTDLVFDSVWPAGLLLKTVQLGKELAVDEVAQIITGLRLVVVKLAVLALGRGPFLPAVGLIENEGILLPLQRGFISFVLLQRIQIFQEKQPRGLLGVVQLAGTSSFFPENVVDVLEGLL